MESNPPELKRDGTMQVTAQEGAEFLKRSGAEDLIPVVDGEGDAKPEVKRDTTMAATLKEGEAFLEQAGQPDETARTRGDQEKVEAAEAESEVPAVPRDNTMQVTAKEGEELLAGEVLGGTRAETEAIKEVDDDAVVVEGDEDDDEDDDEVDDEEENGEEEEEADEEQANLKRTITMTETLAEGEEFLKRQKTNGDATEDAPQAEAAS